MLRWIVIVLVVVLLCGGLLTLAGYAGFEWWRVHGDQPVSVETISAPADGAAAPSEAAQGAPTGAACEAGRAAFAARDYDGATTQLDVCLDAHPDDVDARLLRGRAWAALGRYERAELDLDLALAERPGDESAWEALAYSRVHTEDDRGAVAALDRWIALNPNAAAAWRMRADARFRLGNPDVAQVDAEHACALGDADGCTLASRIKESRRRR